MKFSSLSKVAAASILGAFVLVGCGSDDDPVVSTPQQTSVQAADGYIINLNGTKATAYCSDTNQTYLSDQDQNLTNGQLTFSGVDLAEKIAVSVYSFTSGTTAHTVSTLAISKTSGEASMAKSGKYPVKLA